MLVARRHFLLITLGAWALAALARGADAPAPAFEIEPRPEPSRLLLVTPPPILAEPEVARQLTTGLTATLAFRVEVAGVPESEGVGGARVEVRYELWDEVFHVRSLDAGGRAQQVTIASSAELESWWSEQRFVVLEPAPSIAVQPRTARVTLDVVPFSHSEQLDTQRWFEEAVLRNEGAGSEAAQSAQGGNESLGRVFSVLLATSIRRQALMSYRWNVSLPERKSP